ncbi:sensor histidine kinase [Clostridium frigidicarnis]|uniref:Two-component system, AgrA family, sensor histidine kinase AgrC n=1 Tax=Clostridium frigidicarnis TaxID=84698 RepID=A0A1I1ADD9_9CLOT|nr:GHKL domain-containing protein [Clostridium frigidicarnis]SFB35522.1 two-component system, AgrA family, sensor histidine kinase AgrC [Clostridium frigidicarnis]
MEYFIGTLLTTIFIYISLINLICLKFDKKELLAVILLTQLIGLPFYIKLRFLSIIPINIIAMIFLYKKYRNVIISIIVPLASTLISVLGDYILSYIKIYVLKINPDPGYLGSYMYTVSVVSDFLIIFMISKLIGRLINRKVKIFSIDFKIKFGFLIVMSFLLTLIIFYANIILGNDNGFSNEVIELNGLLFFVYFTLLMSIMYILVMIITKELKIKNRQSQFESLQEYTIKLEALYMDMRTFRHDYINILSSMGGYIESKDIDGLSVFFNNNIMPLSKGIESNNFRIGLLKNIKLPEVKGIMSSKIISAQELGIDVFIDIMEPIEKINMDIIDLCRSLGILIDNAIEAALNCRQPSLKIAFINKNNSVLISIINSYSEDLPPIYKIFQKGFSTKGENRGLGLSNLKKIIENHNNVILDTFIEDDEFIQNIEISLT